MTNVEMAIANLKKADVLSPKAIRELEQKELVTLVYPSGYYNTKTRKQKALSDFIGDCFGDDLDRMASTDMEDLRAEPLGVYGIGEETANDILSYPLGMPAFVVYTCAKRLLFRVGLA
jgi:endonuclease-3 related protein